MSTYRRKIFVRPLSQDTINSIRNFTNRENSGNVQNEPPPPPPIPVVDTVVSPTTDKKKILLQEFDLPEVHTEQQNKKVLLSYSGNEALTDSDDSNSDDSMNDENSTKKSQKSNKKLYYIIIGFFFWAAVQYWMFAVAGFGAVFFGFSALIAIFLNTTKSNKKRNGLSAYSVFNPKCTPIQGSADPKQLEREMIFGGL